MPIKKANGTNECLPALYAGLGNFFDSGDKLAASLPQNHEVLPVYSFGLNQFPEEPASTPKKVPKLKHAGWRFIGTGPASGLGCHIVAAERLSFIGATSNQDIANLLDWFHQVVELKGAPAELSGQEFEVRALRIPGLLIEALWLYCHNSDNDYVVPIAGSLSGSIPSSDPRAPDPTRSDQNHTAGEILKWSLERMRFYTAQEFFQLVGPAARRKLEKDKQLHPANVRADAQGAG